MCYDYDPCNIILIISFVISVHQLAVKLIVRYTWQDHCGTILVTANSMVLNWRVSRAGPMLFLHSCSLTFCLLLFSISLLSFYRLVLWGWGLRTDSVLISLTQPCTANFFNNNNNNTDWSVKWWDALLIKVVRLTKVSSFKVLDQKVLDQKVLSGPGSGPESVVTRQWQHLMLPRTI